MSRKAIPEPIKKALYKESGMLCPMCGEDDFSTFQIHHIEPYSKVKEHTLENMILLCSSCHSKVTAGNISDKEMYILKIQIANGKHPFINEVKDSTPSNVININGYAINDGIIANKVNVKLPKTPKIIQVPPSGAIATSLIHKNYTKYLIDLYHAFKLDDVGKKDMDYWWLYQTIKRKFGAKWDMIDLKHFDDFMTYLQYRVDNTIKGKNNSDNYLTFEDFIKEFG